jgi:putative DNA primase/helicase
MIDVIEQFREAIRSAGLVPPEVIEPDGEIRRFASNGEHGDDAGWYAFHGDAMPAGAFGDWQTGTWNHGAQT